jgi:hypothetical protein
MGGRQKDGFHDAKLSLNCCAAKGLWTEGSPFCCIVIAERLQCMKKENMFVNHDTP